VEEYHKMGEAGIFHEDMRIELIEGELIDMAPIGSLHAATVNDLVAQLSHGVAGVAIVSVQNPIVLAPSAEPQPDIALLRSRQDSYRSALPGAADILLLIEVADSSASYDRQVKIPLYARHGIPEVWLVDLQQKRLQAYRNPDPETGEYRLLEQHRRGNVHPLMLPSAVIELSRLLQ
jgi:Uma2 family endonuclease